MAELLDLSSTPASPSATTRKKAAASNTLPISDILFLTLRKWPWIILSLTVCVGAALVYILRTPTVYTRAAQIMIKDTSKGKSTGMEEFSDLGLISTKTDVENEIINLRSGELMEEVVNRLKLDMNYYRHGRFHNEVAYGTTLPIELSIVNAPADASAEMNIDISPEGNASISELRYAGKEFEGTFTGSIGDTISTPAGLVVVNPTAYYLPKQAVALKVNRQPLDAARASYSSRLSVTQGSDNSSLIRLTLSDRSIERADDVLSTLIDVYKDAWIRDKNEIAVSTSQFINDRLGVIESELGNVDQDISSYKSAHLIPDVQAASSMYMNENRQIASGIMDINNQLQMTRFVRNYLTAESSRNQLLPANSGLVGDIASQVGEYNDLLLQRNSLVEKSSESNPLIISIDGQLAAMRNAIITTVDNQISALNTQLRSLQATQASTTSKIATSPEQAKYLLSVERQQKVKESLYLFLLQKREENELSQAFTAYNTRVINRPGPAGVPPTPAKAQILLIAALVGLALPFGIIFLIENSNTRIRGRRDIEHLTLPFLGEIPLSDTGADNSAKKGIKDIRSLVVKEGRRDVINEAFRVLRTNVEFMRTPTEGANVIAVTSFNPGSGKSFITMNLALAVALKGKRVLVIDGDMRHGSTSAYVGSPEQGLSNYLAAASGSPMELIINDPENANLSILPIGPVPPNPTELLESPRLAELLSQLRPHYDYIFIDCPPIEIVADAQIIDSHVDRTIFIIRAGLLERSMLPELERIYEERKYRNIALILNGTALSTSRHGYSHGYGYGYGYGYGNGYGKD